MQLNSSLRLIATFTVNDSNTSVASHHDFAFNRHPELKEILLSLADNRPAPRALSISDKTLIDAFTDFDIAKIASVDQGQTIHFNELLDINLTIIARFAKQPSTRKSLDIIHNPFLAEWIMNNYLSKEIRYYAIRFRKLG